MRYMTLEHIVITVTLLGWLGMVLLILVSILDGRK